MSAPGPRCRHGAHRPGDTALSVVGPSLLAVGAVVALIAALSLWPFDDPTSPGAAASVPAQPAPASTSPASTSPAETPDPPPAADPPAANDDGATARTVEVVVLNQTTRSGLAGALAGSLREQGWTVPAVGNFRGTVPATTVYYPPGAEVAAAAAAASLPTAPRTRPRFGNLSATRLTVIVTTSYPG